MSLYLKYRPQDFKNLVWQGFIKNTLQKAIETDKTVGAYLFTGPRGTGKTSTARIFAKAVNCTNLEKGNPCLKCEVCTAFADNKLIDVIEIDAASHTGVDNIREIIEKAQFQPTKTRYKIYIIDEVHMLSKGAFNALLKILEEPPEHVKFILATTEIHKVPETILSRCQRYDFKNHTPEDTRERLQYIAGEEKVSVDEDSLDYIIKTANGGLRNAISLFEQLIVWDQITYKHIEETLGVSKIEEVENFVEKLVSLDIGILSELDILEKSGKNIQLFFKDVLFSLWDRSKEWLQKWEDITSLLKSLDILHDTYSKAKHSFDENLTFRIGVMKVLSGFSQETPVLPQRVEIKKKQQVSSDKKIPPVKPLEEKEPAVQQSESLFNDAQDVFSMDEPDFGKDELSPKNSSRFGGTTSWDFDKDQFIAEVKKSGGKGATTMSLRGADFSLKDDTLSIHFKTKIALESVNTPENIDMLNRALKEVGKSDLIINLS